MRDRARFRKAPTAILLVTLVAGMVGLSFAAVPLYRAFCQATGYGGTTQRAQAAPGAASDRVVVVRFDSAVNPELPWRFEPAQGPVTVRLGEPTTVFYRATNLSGETTIGQASFNVTPLKAGLYFDKIQCFCFSEQRLDPGQSAEMPVTFFVDPDMLKDRNLDDVSTITLSYTFFRNRDAERLERERQSRASSPVDKEVAEAGPRGRI
ncbi:MAG TPA: cytochrome c oxidase assembly protein [Alphaproteobacteria bacterium]|nr:cytochrome c oxidase assembly protein [Alphaproteobacteria bacterium]